MNKSEVRMPKSERSSKTEFRNRASSCYEPKQFGSRFSDFFRISAFGLRILIAVFVSSILHAAASDALFDQGLSAYRANDYSRAAAVFEQSLARRPASGTLQNLGNAEWQQGHTGWAILAWEKAVWLEIGRAHV